MYVYYFSSFVVLDSERKNTFIGITIILIIGMLFNFLSAVY